MTFLPIVERELREASRRSTTYWLRVQVTLGALLIGTFAYFARTLAIAAFGQYLFYGLSGLCALYGVMSGRRFTADCLSREKREGTLGLLFLTDLKGYDVVFGKLAGNSISAFTAIITVFPAMSISLLAGGVTAGELWRMMLMLVNTFFVSLSIGMFASSVMRSYRGAMAMNFYILAVLIIVPTCIAPGNARGGIPLAFFYVNPINAMGYLPAPIYTFGANHYWGTLLVSHLEGWVFLILASLIVPRTWGDKPNRSAPKGRAKSWTGLMRAINYGTRKKCEDYRKFALDKSAYFWMCTRARLKPRQVWVFIGLGAIWWWSIKRQSGNYLIETDFLSVAGFILNATLKLWVVSESGQALSEDKRQGTFELILVTRVSVPELIRGQWDALRRQFFWPFVVVTLVELEFMRELGWAKTMPYGLFMIGLLWFDSLAAGWVGMESALRAKSITQSIARTAGLVLVIPNSMFCVGMTSLQLLSDYYPSFRSWDVEWVHDGMYLTFSIIADVVVAILARRTLRRRFRDLALESPETKTVGKLMVGLARLLGRAVSTTARLLPVRLRKPASNIGIALLIVCGVIGAVIFKSIYFPAPTKIVLHNSQGELKVFHGGAEGALFIMPDGTLWRWGKPGAPQSPRASKPEQIGTDDQWVKAVGEGTHCVGLQKDGSLWAWGWSNGRYAAEPMQGSAKSEWLDFDTTQHELVAVNTNGRAYLWTEPIVASTFDSKPNCALPGRHWVSVAVDDSGRISLLKSDGSIWEIAWPGGTYPKIAPGEGVLQRGPVVEGVAWVELDRNGLARDSLNRWWRMEETVAELAPGTKYARSSVMEGEIQGDNTLCYLLDTPKNLSRFLPAAWKTNSSEPIWSKVWIENATGFALAKDGTMWTWGADAGTEPSHAGGSFVSQLSYQLNRPAAAGVTFVGRAGYKFNDQPRKLFIIEPAVK